MTAALMTPTEAPAPVLSHQVQEIDGKPHYFQTDDDKPTLTGSRTTTPTPDLTPVAGHFNVRDHDGNPEYIETDRAVTPTECPGAEPLAAHWVDGDSSGGFAFRCTPTGPKVYTGPITHGPELTTTEKDRARSTLFTTRLWEFLARAGGPRPATQAHHHFPHAFPSHWLATLDLPSRTRVPEGQAVTLTGPGFTRHHDHAAMLAGYTSNPRTWVFECAHWHIPWLNHAARHLTETTASRYDVLAAVYDSRAIDRPSTPHTDAWYSAIIQLDGAKHWSIGPDRRRVTTRPGDILFIPEGLAHAVTTPDDPGHSRHLVFDLAMHTAVTIAR